VCHAGSRYPTEGCADRRAQYACPGA
jgi:hypothetical protein